VYQNSEEAHVFFTYVYLLRVPIVGGVVLAGFAPFALSKGSQLTTLLEGVFDLDFWRVALAALVTLVAGSACAIASELVLRYGSDRFSVCPLPAWVRQPVFPLFRVFFDRLTALNAAAYFLCTLSMLVGLVYGGQDATNRLERFGGVSIGCLVFFLTMLGLIYVWANSPPALSRYLASIFTWTPDGYVQPAPTKQATLNMMRARGLTIRPKHIQNEFLLPGHGFAAIAMGFTLGLYAILGFSKWWALTSAAPSLGSIPIIPTLVCILLLITLLAYLFSGIAFLLDRFRIPFVVPLILIFLASADWPQSDHFFEVMPRADSGGVSPADVLRKSPRDGAIVVATSGGGIQAAAWTAAVLAQLHKEMPGDFARDVRALSSVSGGSVGTMYFLDALRGGTLDRQKAKDQVFTPSATSSLDDIAWGVIYPDFLRLFMPFFGWNDRGWAAEHAWGRFGNVNQPLSGWRRATRDGLLPAVMFNATMAENGSRFVLSTTDLNSTLRGRKSFYDLYPERDVSIVTAARLSASFPYVSPAARVPPPLPVSKSFHFVDGGYYDNYGISSLADWLLEAMPVAPAKPRVTRILIVQIRGPIGAEDAVPKGKRRGFFYQAAVPPATLAHTRSTGQISHNNAELKLLCEVAAARGVALDTALFQYPMPDTPLTWHLTKREIEAVWNAYDHCKVGTDRCSVQEEALKTAREKVKSFMGGERDPDGCKQFEEPPKPATIGAEARS
jgi:hypothetical protein